MKEQFREDQPTELHGIPDAIDLRKWHLGILVPIAKIMGKGLFPLLNPMAPSKH